MTTSVSSTSSSQTLRALLQELEQGLRTTGLWEATPPSAEAMASTMPFMYDTLQVEQWLQWVFIPRLHALLDASAALPGNCSVFPLAEHEWNGRLSAALDAPHQQVLKTLQHIDAFLTDSAA